MLLSSVCYFADYAAVYVSSISEMQCYLLILSVIKCFIEHNMVMIMFIAVTNVQKLVFKHSTRQLFRGEYLLKILIAINCTIKIINCDYLHFVER